MTGSDSTDANCESHPQEAETATTNSESTINSPDCRPVLKWVFTNPDNAHELADRALVAGHEDNSCSQLWLIRAQFQKDLIPGKLAIERNAAYLPWDGKENRVHYIEVCCADRNDVRWIESCNGNVPSNAIIAGYTSYGDTLYVGRAHHQGSLIPGKVQPTQRTLYIPYCGKEVAVQNYEVLCKNQCQSSASNS